MGQGPAQNAKTALASGQKDRSGVSFGLKLDW
jgi:hypothetical protein